MNAYSVVERPGRLRPAERVATIADVALVAGVSPMTVSRVINGGPVKGSTRTKVEAAIRQLGFRPNEAARTLSYQRRRG